MAPAPGYGPEYTGPKKLVCMKCGAINPPKAYCCITCFQILRPKVKVPLWQMALRPSVTVSVALVIILLVSLVATKRWVDAIEARVQMDLKTADYNISLVADKKKRQANDPFAAIEAAEQGTSPTAE